MPEVPRWINGAASAEERESGKKEAKREGGGKGKKGREAVVIS